MNYDIFFSYVSQATVYMPWHLLSSVFVALQPQGSYTWVSVQWCIHQHLYLQHQTFSHCVHNHNEENASLNVYVSKTAQRIYSAFVNMHL